MSFGPLFDLPPPRPAAVPYRETSVAAAESMREGASTLRARVLSALRSSGPMTDEEIQLSLGMNPSTERPRRIELLTSGSVRDSGETRLTKSERRAIVWAAVEGAVRP